MTAVMILSGHFYFERRFQDKRLTELEARKRGLQDAIEAERARSELMQDAHSIEAYFKRYSDPDMFDDDIRDEVLEYFVDKIFVYDDRIIVTGPYFEGIAEQVSFEELADDTIEFDSFAVGSTKRSLLELFGLKKSDSFE